MTKLAEELPRKQKCLILKTLLPLELASKQKLTRQLPKERRRKLRLKSRATVSKRVEELAVEGMIIIKKGPRKADNCSITFPGFLHVMWNCGLSEGELQKAVNRWLEVEELWTLRRLVSSPGFDLKMRQAITKVIFRMKSRVNPDPKYFDRKYAMRTFDLLLNEEARKVFQEQNSAEVEKWFTRIVLKERMADPLLELLEDHRKVLNDVRMQTERGIRETKKAIGFIEKIKRKR